jgi:hypothetical protein
VAVTYDSVSPNTAHVASGNSLSWTHTTVAASCRIYAAADNDDTGNFTLSATCDGSAMTSLGLMDTSGNTTPTAFLAYLQVWYADVAAAGGHSIAITRSGSPANALIGSSLAFTGVTGQGSAVFNHGTNTAVVTAATSSLIAFFITAGNSITATSGATSRMVDNFLGNGPNTTGNIAAATATGTGSALTCTWTDSASSDVTFGIGVQGTLAGTPGPQAQLVTMRTELLAGHGQSRITRQ